MKFLITNPDSFGDIVLRQPLFTGLLDAGHEVGVLVRRSYSQIILFLDPRLRICMMGEVNPYWHGIYNDRDKVELGLEQAAEFDPDVVVLAPFHRTQIDLWTQERFASKRIIGMKGLEVVYDTGIGVFRPVTSPGDVVLQVPEDLRETEKNRRLLSLCLGTDVPEYHPRLSLAAPTLELAKETLKQFQLTPGKFVVSTPGSTSLAVKQYPQERFVDIFAYWSTKYNSEILLVGNQEEEPVLKAIQDQLRQRGVSPAVWIGDDTNTEVLLGMISFSKLYFGNDTGPMHFAAALGKPVLAIFGGGTWPRFIPDASAGAAILQELPCFGCRWKCLFENALCIKEISERRVIEAVDQFEKGKLKSFKVLAEPFEGGTVTTWIAEAKEKMTEYKHRIETEQVAHEKESLDLNQHRALLRSELDGLYSQLSEEQNRRQQMQEALNAKTQEWQAAQLQLQQQQENIALLKSLLDTEKRESGEMRTLFKTEQEKVTVLQKLMNNEIQTRDQKLVDMQKHLETERVRVRTSEEKSSSLQSQLAQHIEELRKEREINLSLKNATKEMESQYRELHQQNKLHQEKLQSVTRQLDDERKRALALTGELETTRVELQKSSQTIQRKNEAVRAVKEGVYHLKPKLEEMHLAIRYQDETLQHMEQGLHGVIQSGWVKMGLALRIPWLSRWHEMMFATSGNNGAIQVKKQDFENPLSVKDHLMKKVNDLLVILDKAN